ncbi:MAG: hypothetical protein ABI743_10410 [bacterium]
MTKLPYVFTLLVFLMLTGCAAGTSGKLTGLGNSSRPFRVTKDGDYQIELRFADGSPKDSTATLVITDKDNKELVRWDKLTWGFEQGHFDAGMYRVAISDTALGWTFFWEPVTAANRIRD